MTYTTTRQQINDRINGLIENGVPYDDDSITRQSARLERFDELEAAYRVVSQALNRGEDSMVLDVLVAEHPTLLGKLTNVVLSAVNLRDGDGRLTTHNLTLGEILDRTGWDRNTKLSEIRQPFV